MSEQNQPPADDLTPAARFSRVWREVGASGDEKTALQALVTRYAEPHRSYHTLAHVLDCLDVFEEAREQSERPELITAAIWYHDVIYDPQASDNEKASADFAMQALRGASQGDLSAIHSLIMATAHGASQETKTPDAALLVDVDLSILGRSAERFDAYEASVRYEYSFVPSPVFRHHRAMLLEKFLEQTTLFLTPLFRARFEASARKNLRRSLLRLRDNDAPLPGE